MICREYETRLHACAKPRNPNDVRALQTRGTRRCANIALLLNSEGKSTSPRQERFQSVERTDNQRCSSNRMSTIVGLITLRSTVQTLRRTA